MAAAMQRFRVEVAEVDATRSRASALAESPAVRGVAARASAGDGLSAEEVAALLLSRHVATDELVAIARARRSEGAPRLETFSPLYLTNECDAECLMCGMRRTNTGLVRETADEATAEAQLDILHRRGLRAVALLTGEYHHGPYRRTMIARTADALRAALARGFAHVLVNIGALDAAEYETLLAGVPRRADGRVVPRVTMCTFQETY